VSDPHDQRIVDLEARVAAKDSIIDAQRVEIERESSPRPPVC
jgi:uncharacterized coiled-coil protein SlyX